MSYSFMGDWSTPKVWSPFHSRGARSYCTWCGYGVKKWIFCFRSWPPTQPISDTGGRGIDHTASEPNMGLNFVSEAKIGTFLPQIVSWKRFGINENILSASIKKFPFEADKIFQMTLDLIQVYVYWSKILILASDTKKNLTRPSRTVCSANYSA
jgi:hypothetical protein